MTSKTTLFAAVLLLFASLACGVLGEEALPTATPTVVATPTLAPTVTPDPAATVAGVATEATVEDSLATEAAGTDTSGTGTANTGDNPPDQTGTAEPGSGSGGDSGQTGGGQSGGEQGAVAACPAPGQNLLLNPSFEGEYKPYGAFTELNHAANWFPWWHDGQNNLRPEFKPAEASIAPNRVHSGTRAQQYFKSFGQFKSGLYQPVLNVTPGTRLQFSVYGQAWSCEDNNMCPGGTSVNPADMLMRVGIDPTGNTDWSAGTVVWSAYFNPLDQWQIACVEAVADAQKVTVFVWASPNGPRQNQDVYWDDASLVVLP